MIWKIYTSILVLVFSNSKIFSQNSITKTLWPINTGNQIYNSFSFADLNKNILISGVIFYGATNQQNAFLAKLDSSFNIIWVMEYETAFNGFINKITMTDDGNYLLVGQSSLSVGPSGSNSVFVSKMDTSGNALWNFCFEGQTGNSVSETNNGDFLIAGIAGRTTPTMGRSVMSVIKIDKWGNPLVNFSYSQDIDSVTECINDIKESLDHGLIMTGGIFKLRSGGSNCAISLIKMDSLFNIEWSKSFYGGYQGVDFSQGLNVFLTSDSGYVISGHTTPTFSGIAYSILMKVDKYGTFEWGKILNYSNSFYSHYRINTISYKSGFLSFSQQYNINPISQQQLFLLQSDSLGNGIYKKTFPADQLLNVAYLNVIQIGDSEFVCINDDGFNFRNINLLKTTLSPDLCTTIDTAISEITFVPFQRDITLIQNTLSGVSTITTTTEQINLKNNILCIDVIDNSGNIESIDSFDLFPDPANELLYIRMESGMKTKITILNIIGNIVYSNNFGEYLLEIDLTGFTDGVYIIHIERVGLVYENKKFIVTHN